MHTSVDTSVFPLNLSGPRSACSQCDQRALCLPAALPPAESDRLDKIISGRLRIRRGHHLYRCGGPFGSIYAVKSGFFKTEVVTADGGSHVIGFQMAGDMLGMDGISSEVHACSAIALEESEVCVIPFADLERLSRDVRTLQRHFHQLMSREIVRDHGVMMLLGSMCAEESLAAFLLSLSQRFTARGGSPTEFQVRLTREEIGSHLGLRLETVSRLFSRFQEDGMISVEQRRIRILDIPGLKRLMTHVPANRRAIVPLNPRKLPRFPHAPRGPFAAAELSA